MTVNDFHSGSCTFAQHIISFAMRTSGLGRTFHGNTGVAHNASADPSAGNVQ